MGKQPEKPSKRGIATCPIDDVSVYLSTPEELALKTALWDLMYGKDHLQKPQRKKQPDKKVGTKRGIGEEKIAGSSKKRREPPPPTPPRKRMSSKVDYDALERLVGGGKGEADGDGEGGEGRPVPEEDEEEGGGDGVFDGDYFGSGDEGDYDKYYDTY